MSLDEKAEMKLTAFMVHDSQVQCIAFQKSQTKIQEDAKAGDHGSTAAVEKAIDRVRMSFFMHSQRKLVPRYCHNTLSQLRH